MIKKSICLRVLLGLGLVVLVGCATPSAPLEESEPMESSEIKNKGYVPDRQSLVITFENGRVFLFTEVPPELYEDFQNAESQAEFFNKKINGKFHFYQIK